MDLPTYLGELKAKEGAVMAYTDLLLDAWEAGNRQPQVGKGPGKRENRNLCQIGKGGDLVCQLLLDGVGTAWVLCTSMVYVLFGTDELWYCWPSALIKPKVYRQ